MPVYLLHGFRWPRAGNTGIRVHCIMHNLEDCSVEYIQNENSTYDLLTSFRASWPDVMKELEGPGKGLTFLEQYDPEDESSESAVSQPFAFVGDRVVTIAGGPRAMAAAGLKRPESASGKGPTAGQALKAVAAANGSALSVNVEEVVMEGPGFTPAAWEALAELRDKLAEKEKIGWWVVYNGDPERAVDEDDLEDSDEEADEEEEEEDVTTPTTITNKQLPQIPSDEKEVLTQRKPPNPPKPADPSWSTPPAMKLPIRSTTGKRTQASPTNTDKAQPPPPETAKMKTPSKSDGLKKKFFGKRG